jgi:5'-3' exoribonuclease 1
LTTDERNRNTWGVSWKCYFSDTEDKVYPSSLPGFFPDIQHCRSVLEPFDLPVLTGLKLVKGLCEGVLLGKDAIAGFPSLHTLPHSGSLGYQSVNVFQADSKNESMVITIDASPLAKPDGSIKMEDVAAAFLNQRVYVNWPFLKEALVVGISDELFRYELDPHATGKAALISTPHRQDDLHAWRRKADRIDTTYSKRYGTILGNVEILVHVKLLKGKLFRVFPI